ATICGVLWSGRELEVVGPITIRPSLRILYRRLGEVWGIADCINGVEGVLSDLRRFEPAARFASAATAIQQERGLKLTARDEAPKAHEREALRAALGRRRFETLARTGQTLDIEDGTAEALAIVHSHTVAADATAPTHMTGVHWIAAATGCDRPGRSKLAIGLEEIGTGRRLARGTIAARTWSI